MFHLFTHAFFKALLFLGAGSVIHAMHHEQDMRHMGGLWNKIPFTCAMMLIGTLALTGFPFTAGYFSKDRSSRRPMRRAHRRRHLCLRLRRRRGLPDRVLLLAARLLTFLGKPRWGRARRRTGPTPTVMPATAMRTTTTIMMITPRTITAMAMGLTPRMNRRS